MKIISGCLRCSDETRHPATGGTFMPSIQRAADPAAASAPLGRKKKRRRPLPGSAACSAPALQQPDRVMFSEPARSAPIVTPTLPNLRSGSPLLAEAPFYAAQRQGKSRINLKQAALPGAAGRRPVVLTERAADEAYTIARAPMRSAAVLLPNIATQSA